MATVCIAHLLFGVDDPVEGLARAAAPSASTAGQVPGVLDVLVALGIRTASPKDQEILITIYVD